MRRRNQIRSGPRRSSGHFKLSDLVLVAICNDEIAKYLDISISTSSIYKSLSVQAGFITRERKYTQLNTSISVSKKSIASIVEEFPKLKGRIRIRNGKLYIQRSDRMVSLLIGCKRIGQKTIYNKSHIGRRSYD